MGSPTVAADAYDFSLVLGGPLYQAYRRAHLVGETLELVVRRIVVVTALAWLPLFVLSLADGKLWSGAREPFLFDISVHVRLLIALPLLIATECAVHQRLRITVQQFLERGLIRDGARPQFEAALNAALRLRNSTWAEVALIAFVYVVGIMVIWRGMVALNIDTWYRQVSAGGRIALAGWWYFLVSLPLFQFLLFRWYYRVLVWTWFLWRVSRSPLSLVPTHPDRCGGLGFIGLSTYAFIPLLFAHGALFAGVAATGILFDGRELASYGPALAAAAVLVLSVALAPTLVFAPALFRVKRTGQREYGALAQRYVREFERKWVRDESSGQRLLGNADIQSLADLANSYEVVSGMRLFTIDRQTLLVLVLATVLPLLPLALTVYSPRDMVSLLWKGLF